MKERSNYLVLTKHRAIKEEFSYALCTFKPDSPKAPRFKVVAGGYRPTPGKVSLPHLPCLARIDALLERLS